MKYIKKPIENAALPVQAKSSNGGVQLNDNRVSSVLQRKQVGALSDKQTHETVQKKANTTGLPDQLKSGIENLSGHAMDDVKVHYNSSQPAQLNAHAYAQGNQIHIASGQEKHLPHEAWHVVQQKQGRVKPTLQMKGKVNVNDDAGLEKEADVMGAKALQKTYQLKQELKSPTVAINSDLIQRKVGVEYETNWNISGNNKANHKQTVIKGSGWHMETDNNNLEFVVFPPANSPEQLRSTVGNMAVTAKKIRGKSGEFATKEAGKLLGNKIDPKFKKENFIASNDAEMSAKAQFSFGISMGNLTKLFDSLTSGLPESKASTKNQTFNFGNPARTAPTTTRNFLMNAVKGGVEKSSAYRKGMKELEGAGSPDIQGFLSYLAYSVKAMEATYINDFGTKKGVSDKYEDNFTDMNKAALLAQEIVKNRSSSIIVADFVKNLGYNESMVDTLNNGVFGGKVENRKRLGYSIDGDTQINKLGAGVFVRLQKYKVKRTKVGMDFPKYRFTLMNRTGFDKMYQTLSATDQKWFRDNIDQVLAKMGRKPNSKLFASPYSYKTKKDENDTDTKEKGFSHGPTIKEWLESIVKSTPKKRDLLSPPKEFIMENGKQDTDQSLGLLAKMDISEVTQHTVTGAKPQLLKAETKKVKQVIIELRSWGDYIKPEDWANHSYDMAYLFSEIAKGDLTQEEQVKKNAAFAAKLNSLLVQQDELRASLTKKFSDNRGQKTNQKNQNRSIRNKLAVVEQEIHKLKAAHKE